ncbi:MAG: DMT family transporter [Anaerolineae bacterium]|nr:DMT family transporter [Anaerolineae bacterium]
MEGISIKNTYYSTTALASGALLALAIFLNGRLAVRLSPAWSSLVVHFVGIFGSWFLWRILSRSGGLLPYSSYVPRWAYLGGLGGAVIVFFANTTVNSVIGLVGSLSLMILGFAVFAILIDINGWLGMPKRHISPGDLLQVLCLMSGSFLIILY